MNRQEFLNRLSAVNPNLKCKSVRMKGQSVIDIATGAYNEGFNHAVDLQKKRSRKSGKNPFDDFFRNTR